MGFYSKSRSQRKSDRLCVRMSQRADCAFALFDLQTSTNKQTAQLCRKHYSTVTILNLGCGSFLREFLTFGVWLSIFVFLSITQKRTTHTLIQTVICKVMIAKEIKSSHIPAVSLIPTSGVVFLCALEGGARKLAQGAQRVTFAKDVVCARLFVRILLTFQLFVPKDRQQPPQQLQPKTCFPQFTQ